MKAKSIDVSELGFKYKGKLARTILMRATITSTGRDNWTQGPTLVFVNGKRVPLKEGQELAKKVYRRIAKDHKRQKAKSS